MCGNRKTAETAKLDERRRRAGRVLRRYPSEWSAFDALACALDVEGLSGETEEWDVVIDALAELVGPEPLEAVPMEPYEPGHEFARWECAACGAVNFRPRESLPMRFCGQCGNPLKI